MTNPSSKPNGNRQPTRLRPGPGPSHVGKIEKAKDPRKALQRLSSYLRPYTGVLTGVSFMVLLYTFLGLLGPYLLGVAIDDYILAGDISGTIRIAIWMLAIYLIGAGFQAASGWLMAKISQGVLKRLRKDLFGHLQSLSLRFFDRNPAGELMSRLTNDIDAINQAVSQNLVSIVASLLTLVGILVAMFVLNFWLALASIIVVPLMFWFTGYIARYTRRGFRRLQKDLGILNATMEETLSGQRVVKAFRRNDSAIDVFRENNEAVYKAGLYANTYALLLMPLTNVLGNFFVIVLVGLGSWLALQGLATVGIIATFITYARRFIQPLRQLANMYNAIQAAFAGAERVFEILDTSPELENTPDALAVESFKGQVRFESVTFGYLEDVPVIKEMSFEANAGETIALVGPTGAGKTTLINLLTRFYDIKRGRITIDGTDLRQIKIADLHRQLGLVLQDAFLFSNTVMENIRYGRLGATDDEVITAARMADADHFIHQLPDGYQTLLSERGGNLSQGQRQLLTIARAILADPSILILDEATSSVDTRTEARIQEALLRLMEGRTSFVIAHRLSTIRDADNLVVVNDGEIVEQGSHQQLLDARGFYHNLYRSQFKGQAI